MAATQQQQYTAANNLADTRTLLRTGIHYEQLVTQAGPFQPGQSCTTIKLNNAGILTGLRIVVQADCTVTSPVTASPYAPYNLLSNITLRDFAGISRINLPGHQLYSILCARYGQPWMLASSAVDTDLMYFPTQDTTGAVTKNLMFELNLPVSYDARSNLDGCLVMASVSNGQVNLNLNFANNIDGTDVAANLFTSGTAIINNIYVTVYQQGIIPQNNAIPLISAQTVYELLGGFSYSTMAPGVQMFVDYPQARNILANHMWYVNGGAVTTNGTDIASINLVMNSNSIILQQTPQMIRADMRTRFKSDLPAGYYYQDHRHQSIQTQTYGAIQKALVFNTVNANSHLDVCWESTYSLGIAGAIGAVQQ